MKVGNQICPDPLFSNSTYKSPGIELFRKNIIIFDNI
jgi:hypothetical protein